MMGNIFPSSQVSEENLLKIGFFIWDFLKKGYREIHNLTLNKPKRATVACLWK